MFATITVLVALLLVSGTQAQDLDMGTDFSQGIGLGQESFWPVLKPPKAVVRAIRAAAPEYFWDTPQTLRSFGYPVESHEATTEDGYVLKLHRIPGGRGDGGNKTRGPPVLLQHGVFGRSDQWVVPGIDVAPGLILADNGYDVWINNVRGNQYCEKHERMTTRDPNFWKFSFHEIGMYDVAAAIDYVLNATGHDKLFYVGHSMGNTVFYVLMSTRPGYNAKVRLQVALAPAVFFDDVASLPLRFVTANVAYIKAVFDARPTYQTMPRSDALISFYYLICGEKAFLNKMCAVLVSWAVGPADLNNTTSLGYRLARSVSSSSALVPYHFIQVLRAGRFQQLDHGEQQNLRIYGQRQPPLYPLQRVTAPVALYGSEGDFLVPARGVERLAKVLPNVVLEKYLRMDFFNHMDFVSHRDNKRLLMDHVLETMRKF